MTSAIKQRKIWFFFSSIMVLASIVAFLVVGLNLGIDFTGGSLLEIEFKTITRPTSQEIVALLEEFDIGTIVAQPIGDNGFILRFRDIDEDLHQKILSTMRQKLSLNSNELAAEEIFIEKRFESIGPSIGQELKRKTFWAILIVLLAIIIYIAWAFRRVSKPIASWKYGLIAVVTLFHDIIITVGIFVVLGKLYGIEANAAFVAALLTILGYSVNDTIVVFDRIRENLIRNTGEEFEKNIQNSVNEVITRSINTSFTTLLTLFAIFLFGGQTIRSFTLTLIVGISIGTYSSIFLASPLLLAWEKLKTKK